MQKYVEQNFENKYYWVINTDMIRDQFYYNFYYFLLFAAKYFSLFILLLV